MEIFLLLIVLYFLLRPGFKNEGLTLKSVIDLLQVVPLKVSQKKSFPAPVRLSNGKVLVFYWRFENKEHRIIESVSCAVWRVWSGMGFTFVDGTLTRWVKEGKILENPELNVQDNFNATRLLAVIRKAIADATPSTGTS